MAPRPILRDKKLVLSLAHEVAATELHPSRAKVASRLEMLAGTFNGLLKREGWTDEVDAILVREPVPPGAKPESGVEQHKDGSATLYSEPVESSPWTAETLLKAHGFDPDEWEVVRARANRWGDPESLRHQLRVDVVPRAGIIAIPDPSSWTPPPKPKSRSKREPYLDCVAISDHHAPHHEPTFHRLFLEYLRDIQPGLIEVNGDLLDFSSISRHRERERYAQPVNECLDAGFGILRDYREVCPDAQIRYKRGNHEERLLHMILDYAKGLHRITPAGDEVPALDLRRLLHLDALHIEYVDEDWDQAKTQISSKLTARHGFSTSRNAGNAMIDKLAGSTVQGHDHRLGATFRTEHQADDEDPLRVRMGIQGGCACIIPGGLGYVAGGEPNWQNGMTAHRVWPNGDFHTTFGVYVTGRFLAPNGVRYTDHPTRKAA